MDFSARFLVTGYEDAGVGVWEMEGGRQRHCLAGHTGGVTGVALQADNIAATSSYDGTVRLWNLEQGVCMFEFKGLNI